MHRHDDTLYNVKCLFAS